MQLKKCWLTCKSGYLQNTILRICQIKSRITYDDGSRFTYDKRYKTNRCKK